MIWYPDMCLFKSNVSYSRYNYHRHNTALRFLTLLNGSREGKKISALLSILEAVMYASLRI